MVAEVTFHQIFNCLRQSVYHNIPQVLILEDHQRDFINKQDLEPN